eukprot:scaffold112865_cov18-Prasinocladus_malaysianus.AAC.1
MSSRGYLPPGARVRVRATFFDFDENWQTATVGGEVLEGRGSQLLVLTDDGDEAWVPCALLRPERETSPILGPQKITRGPDGGRLRYDDGRESYEAEQ